MRWSVYFVERTQPRLELAPLGYVYAKNQPDALRHAFSRWRERIDPAQVQAGFTVELYEQDRRVLGKLRSKL